MGKQLDKDMMRMMTVTERFKYINDKKKMQLDPNIAPNDLKPEAEPWIDRERSDYDDFSDGKDGDGEESCDDDSNEY